MRGSFEQLRRGSHLDAYVSTQTIVCMNNSELLLEMKRGFSWALIAFLYQSMAKEQPQARYGGGNIILRQSSARDMIRSIASSRLHHSLALQLERASKSMAGCVLQTKRE